jgi:hypothetical protein
VADRETEDERVHRIETTAAALGLQFVFYANTGHFIRRDGGKPWGYVVSSRDVTAALDDAESQLDAERQRRGSAKKSSNGSR